MAEIDERLALEEGAVAVMDALGFKGIWQRRDIANLVQGMAKAKTEIEDADKDPVLSGARVRTSFFSDTVVVTSLPPAEPTWRAQMTVVSAALHASMTMLAVPVLDLPCPFRGCITFGKLAARDVFFLGPAIDEAAEWHEQSDAALVWLTPSASKVVETGGGNLLFEWSVPLKGRGELRTHVVNPFVYAQGAEEIADCRKKLLAAFDVSARPDVRIKRQRTEAFLDAAATHTERFSKSK